MKKRTKISIAIAAAVVIAAGLLTYELISVHRYKDEVAEIAFMHKDAGGIPDGTYIGECDVDYVYAKVEVQVKDEQIVGIVLLEHKNGRGQAAESIVDEIIAQQRIDVDVVAGATNSSQVIKKAVDNALSSAVSN